MLGEPTGTVRSDSLEVFDTALVDANLPIANREGPEIMRGLWWMDGNPLPDQIISFHGAAWDPARRRVRISVYGPHAWTWHANLAGRRLYRGVESLYLTYDLQFDASLTFARITPWIRVLGAWRAISPNALELTAKRISDGLWLRYTGLFGRHLHTYALRRIVRANGEREEAYAEYVQQAPRRSLTAGAIHAYARGQPDVEAGAGRRTPF